MKSGYLAPLETLSTARGRLRGAPALVLAQPRSVGASLEPLMAIGREVGAAAGEGLLERIEQMGDLPVGGAVITPAGDPSASFIVHVALQSHEEPVSTSGVRKALLNGLKHICRMDIETLALPPLDTGAGNLDAEADVPPLLY